MARCASCVTRRTLLRQAEGDGIGGPEEPLGARFRVFEQARGGCLAGP